jgi:acyl-coenzyme A synthetase/AMP-(fatty) acid ligase
VDGALRTGDLATVDEDGFIFIVDRKSDFIKSSGHRVSSQEVEAKILELTQVVSAAAVGVPDESLGEAIVVFVVLQSGAGLSAEEIIDYCRRSLARHMTPKQVMVVKALPVNANGKVMKAALREMAASDIAMNR